MGTARDLVAGSGSAPMQIGQFSYNLDKTAVEGNGFNPTSVELQRLELRGKVFAGHFEDLLS